MKVVLKAGRLTRSTSKAVGWDLFSVQDFLIPMGEQVLVPTGVVTELDGCWALIQDRSGLSAKFEVSRRAGVIDPDYNGREWFVVLRNENRKEPYQVRAGDRVAQVIFVPLFLIPVVADGGVVEETGVERQGGLGSTGK